ncbi:MAG TPA: glycoside hydrolase family 3 C-terminal domain-containing protein, partial [Flavobacterium sp.]|nr:glycoside hydrolase family 3 C-terminal domain-containing protein [Flavobacterium sp.]
GRSAKPDRNHVATTLKHFVGHGQPEGGRNTAPINISNYDLLNDDIFPFEYIIKHANPVSLMPSYNEIGGVPNHANPWLIKDVLRKQLGFKGFITSDQSAIEQIHTLHSFAKSDSEAAKIAIENTIDLDLQFNTGPFNALDTLAKSGQLEEKYINESLRKFLKFKYEMGLFDNPFADVAKMKAVTNTPENKKLALEAAEKSLILLKNENYILPLDNKKIKTLAVIGPLAKGAHFGGYSAEPRHGIDVLEGLIAYAGKDFKVTYAEGCKLALEESSFWKDKVQTPNTIADDKRLIQEAVEVAKQSDVIVLAIGETVAFSREAWGENHLGDRASLELLGLQNELVTELLATGKPIVAIIFGGRPLAINEIKKNVPAIFQAFYLGQEGGTALANVIFGKVNPSGKLAITMPKSAGELPAYYNRQPSRMRSYIYEINEPIYPFGFGLSYTTYSYGKPTLDKTTISKTENITLTIPVTNTGKVAGEETVQLYIRDVISSGSRPIMELKDFAKVKLNAGETKNISFTITPEKLMFYNYKLEKVLESGDFKVMVGPNSTNVQTVKFTVD